MLLLTLIGGLHIHERAQSAPTHERSCGKPRIRARPVLDEHTVWFGLVFNLEKRKLPKQDGRLKPKYA